MVERVESTEVTRDKAMRKALLILRKRLIEYRNQQANGQDPKITNRELCEILKTLKELKDTDAATEASSDKLSDMVKRLKSNMEPNKKTI